MRETDAKKIQFTYTAKTGRQHAKLANRLYSSVDPPGQTHNLSLLVLVFKVKNECLVVVPGEVEQD